MSEIIKNNKYHQEVMATAFKFGQMRRGKRGPYAKEKFTDQKNSS